MRIRRSKLKALPGPDSISGSCNASARANIDPPPSQCHLENETPLAAERRTHTATRSTATSRGPNCMVPAGSALRTWTRADASTTEMDGSLARFDGILARLDLHLVIPHRCGTRASSDGEVPARERRVRVRRPCTGRRCAASRCARAVNVRGRVNGGFTYVCRPLLRTQYVCKRSFFLRMTASAECTCAPNARWRVVSTSHNK